MHAAIWKVDMKILEVSTRVVVWGLCRGGGRWWKRAEWRWWRVGRWWRGAASRWRLWIGLCKEGGLNLFDWAMKEIDWNCWVFSWFLDFDFDFDLPQGRKLGGIPFPNLHCCSCLWISCALSLSLLIGSTVSLPLYHSISLSLCFCSLSPLLSLSLSVSHVCVWIYTAHIYGLLWAFMVLDD